MMQRIDFTVRTAVDSDAEQIATLEKQCFSSPWSLQQVSEEIKRDNVIFLSAVTENDFCGYISGQLILDEFYISNVAVDEKYRKCGVATALISDLLNRLKQKKCTFMTLEVRESNCSARRVYEKAGFTNLGIRKDFYSHPVENACIYTFYFDEECD